MKRTVPLPLIGTVLGVLLVVLGACAPTVQEAAQTLVALPAEGRQATPTPGLSSVSLPTLAPTAPPVSGPLATLTAIAPLVASPVPDTAPYTLALDGRPHFIEFFAWW